MARISLTRIKRTCQLWASDLIERGAASESDVRAVAPGGANNPGKDGEAWLRYYGQLQLLRGRSQREASAQRDGGASSDDAQTLAALAAQPVPTSVGPVYPKSLATLLHCHAREIVLGKLAALVAGLKDADAQDEHVELVGDALAEIDYQTRVLAAIALHAGPGMPFAASAVPAATELVDLAPVAVLEVTRAFARANWVNLKAMQSLIEPDPDTDDQPRTRPSWSIFMGSLAIELHENPETLITHRALVSVLASTQLAASARRTAMADAKRKSERERASREARGD